ncbi:LysE family transporter [Staphylococcus pseudintermedius]|uniref:LysE/ArgO family amino acid transporter n=1 Tax=Staphylococcus intermedius group TaxID=2815305 RepID=UPI001A0E8E8A|nr:LysE family transporter [Staphylococcus delphini]EGQ3947130.1 amino acid transporter [Staphylococcus pseudintermedius]EHV5255296.1 LysE family transporter [Staphylococcus pseudintermedius]EIE3864795.1 LysE family transporter [Staphylococcus pseudintermedius]EIE3870756.1 LysE family transporter [Staphylococcus pseudintermedius]EIX6349336.1 LysE family transporter [Staphylococcus pseudintermedius]
MLQALIHGILLALGLILPLGAQNVFVFNQGANHGKISKALPVIITAGLCDTFLIVIAILGVSLILISMPTLQLVIYMIGFLFLMYMAWSLWKEKPSNIEEIEPMRPRKQVLFALSVSLLNPHAIMDTVGVIGTSAAVYAGYNKIIFSIATISVSWIWFVFLAILGKLTGKVDKTGKYIVILNKCSSIIVLIVGLIILKNIIDILN